MKRRVSAPDGRDWVVQLVWWPRPSQAALNFNAAARRGAASPLRGGGGAFSGMGPLVGTLFDAIHVLIWPLVLAGRIIFHRPWLIEAFIAQDNFEGAAWKVRGLGASRTAVEAIADGIKVGNRSPAPPGASAVRFRIKLGKPGLNL
jgi:hypothetical protein